MLPPAAPTLIAVVAALSLATTPSLSAATIAYWEFDGSLTGSGLADSVGSFNLTNTASNTTFNSSGVAAVNPVPNPDSTLGFSGDPAANPDTGNPSVYVNGASGTERLFVSSDPGNAFNLSGKSFTFEGWFQHEVATISSGVGDIIGGTRNSSPFGGYLLRMLPSGSIDAFFANAGGTATTWSIATSGTDYRGGSTDYHHFALLWEDAVGDNLTGLANLYIDGVLEASGSAPVGFNAATADANDNSFIIGNRSADTANKWHGRFDEFRFSDTALEPWQFLNGSGTNPVPEPGTWALLASLLPIGLWLRRRRKAS